MVEWQNGLPECNELSTATNCPLQRCAPPLAATLDPPTGYNDLFPPVCVGLGWGREGNWYATPRTLKVQTEATNAE